MSRLLDLQGREAADDSPLLADEAALPASGACLLPLARWQAEGSPSQGVLLPNTADVLALWPALSACRLIALDFPAFADGRAYSQARLLRERLGYRGELRATGKAVVRDHLQSLARVGFDRFLLRADQDPAACAAALRDFSLAYQPAVDALPTVLWKRRGA